MALLGASVAAFVVFIALTLYYTVAATGHPRYKHMLLFVVLAVLSLIVGWFSLPEGTMQRRG